MRPVCPAAVKSLIMNRKLPDGRLASGHTGSVQSELLQGYWSVKLLDRVDKEAAYALAGDGLKYLIEGVLLGHKGLIPDR